MVAKIAEAIAIGLTDDELSLLAGINPDTMTEWRKDPEFSEAIKRAGAQRLLMRLERIEAGEQGWQGTAWALERLYRHRKALTGTNCSGNSAAKRDRSLTSSGGRLLRYNVPPFASVCRLCIGERPPGRFELPRVLLHWTKGLDTQ